MATVLFRDSFAHYAQGDRGQKWDEFSWAYYAQTASPRRTGAKYLSLTYDGYARKILSTTYNTLVIGCAVKVDGALDRSGVIQWQNTSGAQITLTIDADDFSISVKRGSSTGTVLGTSATGVFSLNTWFYLTFKVYIDDAAGTYDVWIGEDNVLSGTGADTKGQTTAGGNKLNIARVYSTNNNYFSVGDLYITDGDLFGQKDIRIDYLKPNGAGNYSQFTPSAGANYENVDDDSDIDDDTTYNESEDVDEIDSFTMEDLVALVGANIYDVAVTFSARKTDAGVKRVTPGLRISATDYLHGTEITLVDDFKVYQAAWAVNPNDAAAFEEADVNGAELLYKLTAVA